MLQVDIKEYIIFLITTELIEIFSIPIYILVWNISITITYAMYRLHGTVTDEIKEFNLELVC